MATKKENPRYKAEWIKPTRPSEKGNFRITDTATDSRVATCFLEENADMVTNALNGIAIKEVAPSKFTEGEIKKWIKEHLKYTKKEESLVNAMAQIVWLKLNTKPKRK